MVKPVNLLLAAMLLLCGCAEFGPAVSKSDVGNLELNISAPEGLDVRTARIYIDGVFIGNLSNRMPVLQLKRGKRLVKLDLEGAQPYAEEIIILGEPNHQVLNAVLKRKSGT